MKQKHLQMKSNHYYLWNKKAMILIHMTQLKMTILICKGKLLRIKINLQLKITRRK